VSTRGCHIRPRLGILAGVTTTGLILVLT